MDKAIILGNGPSLNLVAIDRVMEFFTIGVNRILMSSLNGWEIVPDRLMIVDPAPLKQEINRIQEKCRWLILLDELYQKLEPAKQKELRSKLKKSSLELIFLNEKPDPKMVLDNHPFVMNHRNTGFYALEYLYRMMKGKGTVGLLGMDMFYPKDQPSHFFGDGRKLGCSNYFFEILAVTWLRTIKEQISGEFKVVNLSPLEGPLRDVIPSVGVKEFEGI